MGFGLPNLICIAVWVMTGQGYFWPEWVLLGTGIGFLCKVSTMRHGRGPGLGCRERVAQGEVTSTANGAGWDRPSDRRWEPNVPPDLASEPERVMTTVLFVDIVGSTERAARLGDAPWRRLLEDHEAMVREQLSNCAGEEVFTRGDELVAAFDDRPARAVRCAEAIRDGAGGLGLQVRAGVHSGEVERRGRDLRGIALHIGQRVSSLARPGEILVSSTVKELMTGSGVAFADRGMHELRGVPDRWRLFSVVEEQGAPAAWSGPSSATG